MGLRETVGFTGVDQRPSPVSTDHGVLISILKSSPRDQSRLPLQACPPAKPARHSPEAKPMADGQGEAARGTSGQVSMYWRSRFIHSSKHTSFRQGVICHRQVRPGFMERRRRCQLSYFPTSEGIGGLGPTILISPLRTLINCGSSSIPVFRRKFPIYGMIRGSFLILKTGPYVHWNLVLPKTALG